MIEVEAHPLLKIAAFTTRFPAPLGSLSTPDWTAWFRPDAAAPVGRTEEHRQAIRRLLRHAGYRPTGRGKPASEYLVRAAEQEPLGPINAAVDACNLVSLHSGVPISVVDLERVHGPLRIAVAAAGERYVFNRSGQEIALDGLLCLVDRDGPCASAVKDSQRSKTDGTTDQTLTILWGTRELADGHLTATLDWYRSVLETCGATTQLVVPP